MRRLENVFHLGKEARLAQIALSGNLKIFTAGSDRGLNCGDCEIDATVKNIAQHAAMTDLIAVLSSHKAEHALGNVFCT
ncbi:hypothetical protein D1F64_03245 [Breoghania sp. L-A4]|nr:hypothetical protein D1F64_03245 [Breoghania sp. L-A4]